MSSAADMYTPIPTPTLPNPHPQPPHTTHTHATHDKHHTPICNHFPVFHWSLWHPLLELHFAPTVNPVWNHCHQYEQHSVEIITIVKKNMLDTIPMHLDRMGLWMGTMCMLPTHHCQSHRQHQQQSEVCTIHTWVTCFCLSYTQQSMDEPFQMPICVVRTNTKLLLYITLLGVVVIMLWACAMTHTAVFHVSWIWTRLTCGADLL